MKSNPGVGQAPDERAAPAAPAGPLARPSREAIAQMPEFVGLSLERIHLVRDEAQAVYAERALARAGHVGFDTESKPVFVRGQPNEGPHVVQLATLEEAFIIQVTPGMPREFLRAVLEADDIVKVGFGLRSDRTPLLAKTGIRLGAAVDIGRRLRESGYRHDVGLKAAVAIVLGRRLRKPKSATTSNWALPQLRSAQLLYAANDAYASLAVFQGLEGDGARPGGASGR